MSCKFFLAIPIIGINLSATFHSTSGANYNVPFSNTLSHFCLENVITDSDEESKTPITFRQMFREMQQKSIFDKAAIISTFPQPSGLNISKQWYYSDEINTLIDRVYNQILANNAQKSHGINQIMNPCQQLFDCAKKGDIDGAVDILCYCEGSPETKEIALVYAILYDQKNFIDYITYYGAKLNIFRDLFTDVIYHAMDLKNHTLAAKIIDADGCVDLENLSVINAFRTSVDNSDNTLAISFFNAGLRRKYNTSDFLMFLGVVQINLPPEKAYTLRLWFENWYIEHELHLTQELNFDEQNYYQDNTSYYPINASHCRKRMSEHSRDTYEEKRVAS